MGGLPVGPFCQDAGGISGPAPPRGLGLKQKNSCGSGIRKCRGAARGRANAEIKKVRAKIFFII